MASFKCKMCGGDLQLVEGETVCECEYCGSRQTVPSADDEKKMTLFNRANRLRFNNEFDKAAGVYESIIADFPEEAEAYWGLILCKYGIEYVDDPATGKKIPTCHRSSFDSVFDDQNFELVMEYSDAVSKRVYREEAKQIEELRKGIVEVSSKEEPYDIFICYKETDENGDRTLDSVLAQDIYNALTEKGYRVFFSRISLEDKLGVEYEPYIFAALHSAKVMLAVGTQYEYYDAVWVKNEWSRFLQLIASGEKKILIPVFKNIDAYDMPKEFARLQAQDMSKVGATQDLIRGIDKIFDKGNNTGVAKQTPVVEPGVSMLNAQTDALLKRGYMSLEDQDYAKAADFFEQVLNNNPECGDAYWGKVLAANQVSNSDGLARNLFEKVKANSNTVERCIEIDTVKAARVASEDSGVLDIFSDEELKNAVSAYAVEPVVWNSEKPYLENIVSKFVGANELKSLISTHDYERALQYKDAKIETDIQTVLTSLKQLLKQEINEDETKLRIAQTEANSRFKALVSQIHTMLSKGIQRLDRDFEIRLSEWKRAKEDYDHNYEAAVAKQQSLQEKRRQLEAELSNLKGLFTGRRKRELEENILLTCKQLNEIVIPKEPGEQPIKGWSAIRSGVRDGEFSIEQKEHALNRLFPGFVLNKFLKNFGEYYYDSGIKKPIQWKILEIQDDKALIITEYGIECLPYNEKRKEVTWETCTLRYWLNHDFISIAFPGPEQDVLMFTKVTADRNPQFKTDPGKDTKDRVFLLSIPEVMKYIKTEKERAVKATPYAKSRNSNLNSDNGKSWWWLRSPGLVSVCAAIVTGNGSVACNGNDVYSMNHVVRPALWIDISKL